MLNKEALLCTKNPPIVFNATVEYDEDKGYYAIRKPSLVSPGIPFWISPYTGAKCILELLMYDTYALRTKFYHDQEYGDDNVHEIAVTVNGITETFTVYRTPVVLMGDVFGLSKLSGQSISVTFDPPPTDISKTDFKSSMEESVDDKQGIIDDGRWGKTHRESYPKLQFKRRRRVYSSKRCVHRESGVFRQQSNTSNRNCHNSCKYRRSATFRNTSNIHSECLRYDWFRFQCWNIHSIRKQCIDKYQATNRLIVLMEALYA